MIQSQHFISILCFWFIFNLHGFTQTIDTSKVKLTFRNESQLHHQGVTKCPFNQKVYIDNITDVFGNTVEPLFHKVTDEPFRHAAFYTMLFSKAELFDKYSIDLDLLFEHRGISYGIYSMDNIVVYPYYKFGLTENIFALNQKFEIKAEIGSFRNSKIHQGLKIYNIDFQGEEAIVNWRNLYLKFVHIGDLGNGIGLGLDELYDYSIGYIENSHNKNQFQFGINLTENFYIPASENELIIMNQLNLDTNYLGNFRYHNTGVWLGYKIRNNLNFYAQFDLRIDPYYNLRDNSALLLGGQMDFKYSNFSLSLNSEFRYYGWSYNYGHQDDDSVNFRKNPQNEEGHYSNTVGNNLYPLKNFDNNFSQWAVYTDYQYQNVAGLEFRISLIKQIYKRFYFLGDFESCTLFKEYSDKPFNYIFYDSHLSYRIDDFLEIGYGISNKAMNLDKHYQTFYMRQIPVHDFFIIYKYGYK